MGETQTHIMEGVLGKYAPRVDMMGMNVASRAEKAVVDVHFMVTNPHPVELDLLDVEFAFEPEDAEEQALVKLVHYPSAIQALSSTLLVVPVDLEHADVKHIACHTMRAEMSFRRCSVSEFFKVSVAKVKEFVKILQPETSRASAYVNGVHISAVSPKAVTFKIILRVSNGNNIPVELIRAEFSLAMQAKQHELPAQALHKTISAKSHKRIEMDQPVELDKLELPTPGNMCTCKLRMDFWFKDSEHGEYKISQEKSMAIPVLAPASGEVKQVVFEHDAVGGAIAKMQLQLGLTYPDPIKLSAKANIDYTISDAREVVVAKAMATSHTTLEKTMMMDMILQPVEDSAFGSALWDVFCGNNTNFKSAVSIRGDSLEYGSITM